MKSLTSQDEDRKALMLDITQTIHEVRGNLLTQEFLMVLFKLSVVDW